MRSANQKGCPSRFPGSFLGGFRLQRYLDQAVAQRDERFSIATRFFRPWFVTGNAERNARVLWMRKAVFAISRMCGKTLAPPNCPRLR